MPGAAPFVRGSSAEPHTGGGWELRTLLTNPDPRDAQPHRAARAGAGRDRADRALRPGVPRRRVGHRRLRFAVARGRRRRADHLDRRPRDRARRRATWTSHRCTWSRAPSSHVPPSCCSPCGTAAASNPARSPVASAPTRSGELAATGRLPQGADGALAEMGALASRLAGSHPGVRTVPGRHHAVRRGGCQRDPGAGRDARPPAPPTCGRCPTAGLRRGHGLRPDRGDARAPTRTSSPRSRSCGLHGGSGRR